jgi:hypothetical protein
MARYGFIAGAFAALLLVAACEGEETTGAATEEDTATNPAMEAPAAGAEAGTEEQH